MVQQSGVDPQAIVGVGIDFTACAIAAVGQSIPRVLTAMTDEFGGAILWGRFASIGGEEIGQQILATLETTRSPAALLQNHSVFTSSPSAEAAVKAAMITRGARFAPLDRSCCVT